MRWGGIVIIFDININTQYGVVHCGESEADWVEMNPFDW